MALRFNNIVKGISFAMLLGIWLGQPAEAVLEGTQRQQFEQLDFSENMIRNGLYGKTGREVFNRDKKAFVRGCKVHNAPQIYEPDVYTWELAMAEHRKKLAMLAPPEQPPVGMVSPVPMSPDSLLPSSPTPLKLFPTGPQSAVEKTFQPSESIQNSMNELLYRARAKGLHPGSELRAANIRQKLVEHINSLSAGESYQPGNPSIPALLPALPDLPGGTRGDSYDGNY